MDSLEALFEHDAALVFGAGRSGDVVGAVPPARLLEAHGLDVVPGGVAWEPVPKDSRAGPRSFDEIEGIDPVSETVALASGETRTRDGLEFAETAVARHTDNRVALVDISRGVDAVREGIAAAVRSLDFDLVVGVDTGGGVLGRGDDPGVRSPVTDGIGPVALDDLATDACLGVFGYGSDGELALDELEARIAAVAARDGLLGAWGLTPRVRDELEGLLAHVDTEASRGPVAAARGKSGERAIRGGDLSVRLTPASPVTFSFDPGAVAATSRIATRVRDTDGLAEATAALEAMGLQSEFETERRRLEGS